MIDSHLEERKRKLAEQAELNQAYASAFSTPDGKRVLQDICERFAVFHGSFDPEPHTHAYNEGMRAVALYIFERMFQNDSKSLTERFQEAMKVYTLNKETR